MRRVIAGNWKMNGLLADAGRILTALRGLPLHLPCDVVVCPPATLLHAVAHMAVGTAVQLGGQDCHAEPSGAHTGDIGAPQLRDAGAGWVILGHSERRAGHGETDAAVRAKVLAAQGAGLTPIVCVGESAEQREAGRQAETVGRQLAGSLPQGFQGVIAYEPIWAIGTGRMPRPEEIQAMHAFVRAELRRGSGPLGAGVPILYGGSVKASNCDGLLAIPEVAGALVGGASLAPDEFAAIVACAGALSKASAGG